MARTLIPYLREDAMMFSDLARQCVFQLDAWGYSKETVSHYDRIYRQYLAFVKSRGQLDEVRGFSDELVLAFATDLGARKIHPNTIIKMLSALSTLAKYGMTLQTERKKRVVVADPTASFRWPTAQRQETSYLYPAELKKLIAVPCPPYQQLARDLLIETGMRVGEAARLSVGDFRQAESRYYLSVRVKGRGQQRKNVTREIPLSKGLGDAIRDWLLSRAAVDAIVPLLVNSDSQRWLRASLGNMIHRLAKDAGITRIRVSPHKLRHTANVIGRLANVDGPTRSRLFGHSSLRSIERYDHVLPHELHAAREQQLDALHRYIGPDRAHPETEDVSRNSGVPNVHEDADFRESE
jgi:integrase/recombinase XerD